MVLIQTKVCQRTAEVNAKLDRLAALIYGHSWRYVAGTPPAAQGSSMRTLRFHIWLGLNKLEKEHKPSSWS